MIGVAPIFLGTDRLNRKQQGYKISIPEGSEACIYTGTQGFRRPPQTKN